MVTAPCSYNYILRAIKQR